MCRRCMWLASLHPPPRSSRCDKVTNAATTTASSSTNNIKWATGLLCWSLVLAHMHHAAAVLVSSGQVETCIQEGPTAPGSLGDCRKRLTLQIAVSSDTSVSEVYYIDSALHPDGVVREMGSPLLVVISKTQPKVYYPLTYETSINNNPYELSFAVSTPFGGLFPGTGCNDSPSSSRPSCGWMRDYKGDRVPDSQGFCCACSLGDQLGGPSSDDYRNQLNCGLFGNGQQSAHCFRYSELWYDVWRMSPARINYDITVTIFRQPLPSMDNAGSATTTQPPPSTASNSSTSASPANNNNTTTPTTNTSSSVSTTSSTAYEPTYPPGHPCLSNTIVPGLPDFYCAEVLSIGVQNKGASALDGNFSAIFLGDYALPEQLQDFTDKYLLSPAADLVQDPSQYPQIDGGLNQYLLIDKYEADFSGTTCNKLGVGPTAFRTHGKSGGCGMPKESCLNMGQPQDYYDADVAAIQNGEKPRYFASAFGQASSNIPAPYVYELVYTLDQEHTSNILLQVRADDVRVLQTVSEGIIAQATVPQFEALSNNGYMSVAVVNTGLYHTSMYYLSFECSGSVIPIPARSKELAPYLAWQLNVTVQVTLSVASDHQCTIKLADALFRIIDTKTVVFTTTSTCFCLGQCNCDCDTSDREDCISEYDPRTADAVKSGGGLSLSGFFRSLGLPLAAGLALFGGLGSLLGVACCLKFGLGAILMAKLRRLCCGGRANNYASAQPQRQQGQQQTGTRTQNQSQAQSQDGTARHSNKKRRHKRRQKSHDDSTDSNSDSSTDHDEETMERGQAKETGKNNRRGTHWATSQGSVADRRSSTHRQDADTNMKSSSRICKAFSAAGIGLASLVLLPFAGIGLLVRRLVRAKTSRTSPSGKAAGQEKVDREPPVAPCAARSSRFSLGRPSPASTFYMQFATDPHPTKDANDAGFSSVMTACDSSTDVPYPSPRLSRAPFPCGASTSREATTPASDAALAPAPGTSFAPPKKPPPPPPPPRRHVLALGHENPASPIDTVPSAGHPAVGHRRASSVPGVAGSRRPTVAWAGASSSDDSMDGSSSRGSRHDSRSAPSSPLPSARRLTAAGGILRKASSSRKTSHTSVSFADRGLLGNNAQEGLGGGFRIPRGTVATIGALMEAPEDGAAEVVDTVVNPTADGEDAAGEKPMPAAASQSGSEEEQEEHLTVTGEK